MNITTKTLHLLLARDMTLLEWYAGRALSGMLTDDGNNELLMALPDPAAQDAIQHLVDRAYEVAEIMLAKGMKRRAITAQVDFAAPLAQSWPSVRIANALRHQGVNTLSDLLKLSWTDIFYTRNLGHASARRLFDELRRMGLELADPDHFTKDFVAGANPQPAPSEKS